MNSEYPQRRKPLKVFSADRIQRKSVVSSTFVEFITICRGKFKVGNGPVRLVLEEDGTEVDGDYWETLPSNSTLLLLTEKGRPQESEFVDQYESASCSSEKIPLKDEPSFPEKRKLCEDHSEVPEKRNRSDDETRNDQTIKDFSGRLSTRVSCGKDDLLML
ncbi:uncharacterized protein LOC135475365 isoform X3 [Liolophura sinensis]|uniref:uncharacterized protein LOC135475365 isoform X3 n=1 Tax=Liolophura sinensis TaxID=3198878 RepID=UPI003159331E